MWIVLGLLAIITAMLNLLALKGRKDPKWYRFLSLSFTSLTMCAFYSDEAAYVLKEDWAALSDIMPIMSKLLWFCVIASIILNSITLLAYKERRADNE